MSGIRVSPMPFALPWAGEEGAPAAPTAVDGARLRGMVAEHYDFIWRSLAPMGVPEAELDDCAQQVFVVAARRLASIAAGSERPFLFATAQRVAAGARRTQQRRREVPEDAAIDAACLDPLPDEVADQRRLLAAIDAMLAAMPEELRVVFHLFEVEEMSTPAIAALLGIPPGTAASRLRRAREDLDRRVARLRAQKGGPR